MSLQGFRSVESGLFAEPRYAGVPLHLLKNFFFCASASCVSADNRQFGRMEVFRFCKSAALCALMSFVTPLCAQTSSVAVTTASARATAPTATFDLDNQHKIRPGDKLSFRVSEDREEAKPLTVTDSGEVELPSPFGRFSAAGKT